MRKRKIWKWVGIAAGILAIVILLVGLIPVSGTVEVSYTKRFGLEGYRQMMIDNNGLVKTTISSPEGDQSYLGSLFSWDRNILRRLLISVDLDVLKDNYSQPNSNTDASVTVTDSSERSIELTVNGKTKRVELEYSIWHNPPQLFLVVSQLELIDLFVLIKTGNSASIMTMLSYGNNAGIV